MSKVFFKTILAFILGCSISIKAQQIIDPEVKIKELRRQLEKVKSREDSTLVHIQLGLGRWYLERNAAHETSVDSAAFFFGKAMDLAKSLQNGKGELLALTGFCEVYFRRKQIEQCDECFDKVIESHIANGDLELQAHTWFRRGITMWRFHVSNASKYPEMLRYYENALSLYTKIGEAHQLDALEVKLAIADMHLCEGKLDQADHELHEILRQYQGLAHSRLHPVYYLLGVINRIRGDLDQGLFYALKSVENAEKTNETYQLAKYLSVVADVYRELDNPTESSEWYKRALYEWEFNNSMGEGDDMQYRFIHYLCKNMAESGNPEEALLRLKDFESKFPPKELEPKALVAGAKGIIYSALGKYGLAEENYLKSIQYFNEMDGAWPIYLSEINQELGNSHLKSKQYQKAKTRLLKALDFNTGNTAMSRRREIYLSLFKVDSAMGDYGSAISYYQKFKITSDSIFNEKKSAQIEALQIEFETAKKENEITRLQSDSAIQSSRLRQATLTKNFSIGILVLFVVIISLLLHSYLINRKSNRLLTSQKGEIESQNKLLEKLVEDKEWLLKEVHHRVKNNLQIVMSLLNTQSYFLQNEDAQKAIQNSQNRLFAISLIHQKLYKTNNLDSIDMSSYLEDLVYHLKEGFENQGQIHFDLQVEPMMLDTTRSVPIGLILNEAITNSIKHGFPHHRKGTIKVEMNTKGKYGCFLTVRDDGVGFDRISDAENVSSLGFSLIKGLCKQLNATLSIKSEKGVEISIFFVTEGTIAMDK